MVMLHCYASDTLPIFGDTLPIMGGMLTCYLILFSVATLLPAQNTHVTMVPKTPDVAHVYLTHNYISMSNKIIILITIL